MSTENPLAVMQDLSVANVSEDAFDAIKASGSFLPRLQLMTANSEKCKSGEFPINHYARVQDSEHQDLGAEVDILVVAWRPCAIENTPEGDVIVVYDPQIVDGKPTGEFARIAAEAEKPGLNGCMYGPQFLVWVGSTQEFMTFLMGSKTARRASAEVKSRMHDAATLMAKKIETKDYTWYGPTCKPCTTPFEMPSAEECKEQVEKFLNPPKPDIERAEETTDERE